MSVGDAFERRYRLLSYEFRVRSDFEDVGRFVHGLLSRFALPGVGNDPSPLYALRRHLEEPAWVALYLDDYCLNAAPTWPQVLDAFFWHMNRETFLREEDRLVVHSAAVSRRGAGIILPAPPNAGKTTLSAALTHSGLTFLSDEAAIIDPETGNLHPFPRVLAMDEGSRKALRRFGAHLPDARPEYTAAMSYIQADRLGTVGEQCRIRYVIAPRYTAGRSTHLEPMSRGDALVTLVENCFNFESFSRKGFSALARVVSGAECYRLEVGDLEEGVRAVRAIVG